MLIPILLQVWSADAVHSAHDHGAHAGHAEMIGSATVLVDLTAVGLHTLTMFAVMGAGAVVVYEKFGVMLLKSTCLKSTWFNLDLLWAGALIAAGVTTLVI